MHVTIVEKAKVIETHNLSPEQITNHASNPRELPAIKDKLWYMSREIDAKRLLYEAQPVRNPWMASTIAKVDYDYEKKILALMVFIPQVEH